MINRLEAWLAARRVNWKTLTGVWSFVLLLWAKDPHFKDFVWGIYQWLPGWVHLVTVGFIVPVLAGLKLRGVLDDTK